MLKMFSESTDVSMMRVMSFLALLMGFSIAIVGLVLSRDTIALVGIFVGGAFGGKVSQKFAEVRGVMSGSDANDNK